MGKKKQIGRKSGGHNKGYWYRKGRGWYVTIGTKKVPLLDERGDHLKAVNTPAEILQKAYANYVVQRDQALESTVGSGVTVFQAVTTYLNYSQAEDRPATFVKRGEYLFDFCFGLTARFWDYGGTKKPPTPTKQDKFHDGFAKRLVKDLIPLDIYNWVKQHPNWGDGTARIAIQGLKRCFNYCVEMGVIQKNPIKGMKVPKSGERITYLTEEQEAAIYDVAPQAFGLMIKGCILTGCRHNSEFARVTKRHVKESPEGMVWRFSPKEHKTGKTTGKDRIIFVPPELAEIARKQMAKYPSGPIFRNSRGTPWAHNTVKENFARMRRALAKKGIKLDKDACMYSCRHTYAKRMLGGYSGQPVTLAILAELMGNSPEICHKHYGKLVSSYDAPLWAAVNGRTKG